MPTIMTSKGRTPQAGSGKSKQSVVIRYGIHKVEARVSGKTVGELRRTLSQPFNLDPNALALVNYRQVSDQKVLQAGDQLEFVRIAGAKGGDLGPASSEGHGPDPESVYTRASFCHFSALFGLLLWMPTRNLWIPIGHLAGPLLVWLGTKTTAPFTDKAGREAINFQLNMSVYGAVLVLVCYRFFLLSYLVLALILADISLVAVAGVKVSRGESYRYPLIGYRLLR